MIRFFEVLIGSIFWLRALKYTRNSQYGLAYRNAVECENFGIKRAQISLLKGVLLVAMHKDEQGIEELGAAIALAVESEKLQEDDKKYIRHYATNMVRISKNDPEFFDENFYVEPYKLDKVRERIRVNFPLTPFKTRYGSKVSNMSDYLVS